MREGAYCTWTPAQIRAALPAAPATAQAFIDTFAIADHGPVDGANVLHLQTAPTAGAARIGLSLAA